MPDQLMAPTRPANAPIDPEPAPAPFWQRTQPTCVMLLIESHDEPRSDGIAKLIQKPLGYVLESPADGLFRAFAYLRHGEPFHLRPYIALEPAQAAVETFLREMHLWPGH